MISKYFYNLSITIVCIVTVIFVLTTVGGLFHIPVNPFYVFIPFIGGIYYLKKQSHENFDFLKQLLILLLIIMISCMISVYVWDSSSDGRWYHSATLIMLKNGWLPVYQHFMDFAPVSHVHQTSAFWGNCYPKFIEIVGANIYKLTNLIESAKSLNFIMLSAVFMYSFSVLKEFNPQRKFIPFIISALIILNPVCICQWFTNFIDIHLYFALTLLVLTIIKIEIINKTSKTDLFMFVSSALMLAMTKFTGCMYLFVICFTYFIFLLLLKRELKKYIKTVLVIGTLIILTGISPFYTNFRDYGHPFYPVCGKNRIIVINNPPVGFKNMSAMERLFRSTFSESVQSIDNTNIQEYDNPVRLKIPFTINKKSFGDIPNAYAFCFADMRIGGFGYLWSGILLLSLFYLPFIRFRNKKEKNIFWLITPMVLVSAFTNPHCWWARLIPQFWLFPLFILFFGMLQENYKNKFSDFLKLLLLYFVMISFIFNSLIILYQNTIFNLQLSKLFKETYNYIDLNKQPQDKILLMVKPDDEKIPTIDETIITHFEEYFGKENIIYVHFDEKKINQEEFFPIQKFQVLTEPYYFFKIENRP